MLEFLVKNGSERVVDDARSHVALIKMLKQFHYIDQNGKDQGINVRNRSSELGKLLGDVDQIRAERKKSRQNRNKYGGVEGGSGMGFSSGSGRYGGFGSESGGYGSSAYSGKVFGDGGGFGGQDPSMRYEGTQTRGDQFEEYDAGEDEDTHVRPTAKSTTTSAAATSTSKSQSRTTATKPKEPVQDLFDFGDEPVVSQPSNGTSHAAVSSFSTMQSSAAAVDDDFDDFQSAPSVPTQTTTSAFAALSPPPLTSTTSSATTFAAPQPVAPPPINSILSSPSPAPSVTSSVGGASVTSPVSQSKPLQPTASGYKPSGPNYYTSVRADINKSTSAPRAPSTTPSTSSFSSSQPTTMANLGKPTVKTNANPASGGDAFANIWNMAGSKSGLAQKPTTQKGPGLADMAKQKSTAGIWGTNSTSMPASSAQGTITPRPSNPTPNTAAQGKPAQPLGNGLDDLLG